MLKTTAPDPEYDQKLDILQRFCEVLGKQFKPGAVDLIIHSLRRYCAEDIDEGTRIYLGEYDYFSVKRLMDVIEDCVLPSREEKKEEPKKLSPEEEELELKKRVQFCERNDMSDLGLSPEEYALYKKREDAWAPGITKEASDKYGIQ